MWKLLQFYNQKKKTICGVFTFQWIVYYEKIFNTSLIGKINNRLSIFIELCHYLLIILLEIAHYDEISPKRTISIEFCQNKLSDGNSTIWCDLLYEII